jgi:hypothetical protein
MVQEVLEEWRPVLRHPNYEVSSFGNVRGVRDRKVKSVTINHGGYRIVALYAPSKRRASKYRKARVCCLVTEAFHGKRPTRRHDAAHCNGNNQDDRAANLKWKTKKANAKDRVLHGTWPPKRPAKLVEERISA